MSDKQGITKLCNKIVDKMQEVEEKTPKSCYIGYKNELYRLLKLMDTSIKVFNK